MPLPVIPGVLRSSVGGVIQGGGRWSNTWHFRRVDLGVIDEPLALEVDTALLAFYVASVLSHCPAGTTLTEANHTPLDGTSGAFTYTHSNGGTSGITANPAELAECLTIRSADRGRRARGRVFFPAYEPASYTADGHIQATATAAAVAGATAMQIALLVLGWETGIASYGKSVSRAGVTTTWSPFFTVATGFSMDDLADVIRGRKR